MTGEIHTFKSGPFIVSDRRLPGEANSLVLFQLARNAGDDNDARVAALFAGEIAPDADEWFGLADRPAQPRINEWASDINARDPLYPREAA